MKRTKDELMKLLVLEQQLTSTIVGKLGLIWNDEWNVFKFPDNTASFLPYDEYLSLDIIPINFENEYIDAVLFFGDGTIEFHLDETQDALNWGEFSTDIIEQVLTNLSKSTLIGSYIELLAAIKNNANTNDELVLQASSSARNDILHSLLISDEWKITNEIKSSSNVWRLFENDNVTISINNGVDDIYEDIVILFKTSPAYVR